MRRAETQVEMRFGETLAIGGLVSRRQTTTSTKIPLFGEIPWLGALFSRKVSEWSESELIILVTPQYAGSAPAGQLPPGGPGFFTDGPTDKELFFYNMIELPKYGEDCANCNGGVSYGGQSAYGSGYQAGGTNCGTQGGIGCTTGGGVGFPGVTSSTLSPPVSVTPPHAMSSAHAIPMAPPATPGPVYSSPAPMAAPQPPPARVDSLIPKAAVEDGLPGLIEPPVGTNN